MTLEYPLIYVIASCRVLKRMPIKLLRKLVRSGNSS